MYVYICVYVYIYIYIYIYIYRADRKRPEPERQSWRTEWQHARGKLLHTGNRHLEIVVDFQWHFPMDFQWHFPTESHSSVVFPKIMALVQWIFIGIVKWNFNDMFQWTFSFVIMIRCVTFCPESSAGRDARRDSCEGFAIISTTYVSTKHETSMGSTAHVVSSGHDICNRDCITYTDLILLRFRCINNIYTYIYIYIYVICHTIHCHTSLLHQYDRATCIVI